MTMSIPNVWICSVESISYALLRQKTKYALKHSILVMVLPTLMEFTGEDEADEEDKYEDDSDFE